MTPKQQVLAVYPKACVYKRPWRFDWAIFDSLGNCRPVIGQGTTAQQAWADAARKMGEARNED